MKTPASWQLPSRRRELEQGKAPREVTFCLDERDQAEYRRRWLDGEEISDIRRDIAARGAETPSWEPASDAQETQTSPRRTSGGKTSTAIPDLDTTKPGPRSTGDSRARKCDVTRGSQVQKAGRRR